MSIEDIKDHQSESDSFREWFRDGWERNKSCIDNLLEHNKTLSDNLTIVLAENQRLVEALQKIANSDEDRPDAYPLMNIADEALQAYKLLEKKD